MEAQDCLIAGLPFSGKSTYIGALWHVVKHDTDKIDLSLVASDENLPENTDQLNTLSKHWRNVEDMDRTSKDVPNSISMILKSKDEDTEFTLNVPDFKGESIRQIITKNQPTELDNWCEKANCIMYMMSNISPGIYADDFPKEEEEEQIEETLKVVPPLKPEKMTPATQNMLILRYIREYTSCRKIAICITAWDKITRLSPNKDPEEYLQDESPALYNFIKFHFPEVLFFGISAQGAEYEYEEKTGNAGKVKVIKEESRKKLLEKTREGKRAFINNESVHDITIPLAALLR